MYRVKITDKETMRVQPVGYCDICGKKTTDLYRTHFKYEGVKCECHMSYHLDIIHHCKNCKPETPKITIITMDKGEWFSETKVYKIDNREEKLRIILGCGSGLNL